MRKRPLVVPKLLNVSVMSTVWKHNVTELFWEWVWCRDMFYLKIKRPRQEKWKTFTSSEYLAHVLHWVKIQCSFTLDFSDFSCLYKCLPKHKFAWVLLLVQISAFIDVVFSLLRPLFHLCCCFFPSVWCYPSYPYPQTNLCMAWNKPVHLLCIFVIINQ
jgi:hypothetical protein